MFPEPTMTSLKCLCCLNISQKSKYIQFIIIKDVEMHEIHSHSHLRGWNQNKTTIHHHIITSPPPSLVFLLDVFVKEKTRLPAINR